MSAYKKSAAMQHKVHMVTGGWRSGASAYALKLSQSWERRTIITTQMSRDEDILEHIANYKRDLVDDTCETVEVPVDIVGAIKNVRGRICIVDDIGTWIMNIMSLHDAENPSSYKEIDDLIEFLKDPPCEVIIVTREMNMGLHTPDIKRRRYRDVVGRANQKIAALADTVYIGVSGLPLKVK